MSRNIVMIHGMMQTPLCWNNYQPELEKAGFICQAPALRFHQLSQKEAPDARLAETSILDYVADLEKEIDKLAEPPILMGHSMGGLLAQILAARGKAKALVLLTPAPPHGTVLVSPPSSLRSFSEVLQKWKFWQKPFRLSFEKAVYSVMHLLPEEEQKAQYQNLVYESGKALFEIGMSPLDGKKASRVNPEAISCPVLVISGKEDRIVPASVVKKIARRYPQAVYWELEDHAHWVLGEKGWEEIVTKIIAWVKENVPHQSPASSNEESK
ncbi:MAG: hypothetical protein OHK0053_19440 [Microscillaceae bacterium]